MIGLVQRLFGPRHAHAQERAALERRLADCEVELRETRARMEAALRGSTVTLAEQDEQFRYTWVLNPPAGIDPIGRSARDLVSDGAEELEALKRQALVSAGPVRAELRMTVNGQERWFDMRVQPTRLRDERPGLITVATDITQLKRQQEHLEVVMRELNHRSKNLLTMVQAIARQTAVGLDAPPAFMERFGERLRALAAAHDVLVDGAWRGADLRAVVEGQLRHQLHAEVARVRLDGEPVALAPEMAHYVGLAVHELGVNAAKYGALSTDDGSVDLSWRVDAVSDDLADLHLSWRERDGPEVREGERRGFGRTILEVLTPRALGGEARLEFDPTGVVWSLRAPVARAG